MKLTFGAEALFPAILFEGMLRRHTAFLKEGRMPFYAFFQDQAVFMQNADYE